MKLQARLLLSYLLLIGVTLSVIVAILLFALGTRPAPPLALYRQLISNLQVGLRSLNLEELVGGAWPPTGELSDHWLHSLAEATDVRVLLIDLSEPPRVRFDSSSLLEAAAPLQLRRDVAVNSLLPLPGRGRPEIIAGSFREADDTEWLFIGLPPGRPRAANHALVLASPRPRQSLGEALNEFGAALGAPLLQAALAGALAAIVLSLAVSRTIAGPLQQIAGAARAIARGEHDQRVSVSGPPEMQDVATAFNQMSSEVQATQQAQKDFLVNVSHDLRTPLTSIQGYSQAIIDGAAQDAVAAARVVHEEAGRLNRMVTGISDLARLQDPRLTPALEALDVGGIIDGVVKRLAVVADAQQVTLEQRCDALPTLRGDGDRLVQVMTNLLDNAIRFTPAGGEVRVSAGEKDRGVEIRIVDNGAGIPPEDLPRVFERFFQVDRARGPRRGSGLGLAIAREIVQAHGGKIHARSEGPGKGSTFTVWLPLAGPAATSNGEGVA
ncbi:MAG: HAMP domain-containing sensor histidine kinase [Anaerolineaceae bacterium]|nr:HAMP domain-containing sensor histidine kinase [Anaerolineaceae bacterium]MDE0329006.1 HAMP domain-containing sensor histidine kinase [Anaerolineaceae bacterium]